MAIRTIAQLGLPPLRNPLTTLSLPLVRSGPRVAAVVAVLTGTVVVPAAQAAPVPLLCAPGGPAATFSGSVAGRRQDLPGAPLPVDPTYVASPSGLGR